MDAEQSSAEANHTDNEEPPSTSISDTRNIGSTSLVVFGNLCRAGQGTLRGCLIFSLCGDIFN